MEEKYKQQYEQIKQKYPDALLLFRCDDFYQAYCEDAKDCSSILDIPLSEQNGAQFARFKFYALDSYLPKLIRAGKRVAICDALN